VREPLIVCSEGDWLDAWGTSGRACAHHASNSLVETPCIEFTHLDPMHRIRSSRPRASNSLVETPCIEFTHRDPVHRIHTSRPRASHSLVETPCIEFTHRDPVHRIHSSRPRDSIWHTYTMYLAHACTHPASRVETKTAVPPHPEFGRPGQFLVPIGVAVCGSVLVVSVRCHTLHSTMITFDASVEMRDEITITSPYVRPYVRALMCPAP
jgi:hypothetical protein